MTILVLVVILLSVPASSSHTLQSGVGVTRPRGVSSQPSQMARSFTTYPYDEQVGVTFTQSFSSLAFNVTAVAQSDGSSGAGPAYLLNGLTNMGYWYQVGVSYNWPNVVGGVNGGFKMNYEVFDPSGCSIFPYPTSGQCGGGGLQSLVVNQGDIVLLSLNFSTDRNVVMLAQDWNTSSTASQLFSAETAAYFVGLPNSAAQYPGFFSGLMTEQYHSSPYYGSGQPVEYSESGSYITSAWMWMDEFDSRPYGSQLFLDQTPSPVMLADSTVLNYFSSNGTAEAVGQHELVTGISPVYPPTFNVESSVTAHPGQDASLLLQIQNQNDVTVRIVGISVQSDLGNFVQSSWIPFNLNAGGTNFNTTITLPPTSVTGNHTLTVTLSWQFLNSQTQTWIAPPPLTQTTLLHVTPASNAPPSNPPHSSPPSGSSGPSSPGPNTPSTPKNQVQPTTFARLLPMLQTLLILGGFVYVASGILAASLLLRGRRERSYRTGLDVLLCPRCGAEIAASTIICPVCGLPAATPTTQA